MDAFNEIMARVVDLADGQALIELEDGSRRRVAVPSQIAVEPGQQVGLVEFDDGSPPIFDWSAGSKATVRKLYVRLLDEGVDVWRPVRGLHQSENVYRILSEARDSERWEFGSGTYVRCRSQTFSDGEKRLVAFEVI